MKSKLEYAVDCIRRGWVITPILPNQKVPRYKWKEAEGQIIYSDEAEYHWTEYPQDNIAIITGKSGLYVVDVDSVKYTVDAQVIQEIMEYPTFTVKTQSGGFHYYYESKEVSKDKTGVVNGVDIKCDGYVLAPGSDINGNKYQVIENIPIAPVPLFSFIKEEPPKAKNSFLEAIEKQNSITRPNSNTDSLKTSKNELEKLKVALGYIKPEGYEEWIKVGMAIKEAGGDISLWDDWSQSSPKYSPGYCEKKWKSFRGTGVGLGSIYHLAKKAGYTYTPVADQKTEEEKKDYALPNILSERATKDLSWFGNATNKYPHYETGIEWFDEATRGIQDTTILTAPSNTGKTALALQIAKSVSKLGKPVLYIDFEQGSNGLYGRMLTNNTSYDTEDLMVRGQLLLEDPKFLEHYNQFNEDIKNVYITHLNQCDNMDQVTEYIQKWQETVSGRPLIIIDQIRGLSHKTGQDNLFEQTRMVANWIQDTPRINGWTVLAISPQNKREDNEAEINAISGSSDLGYSVDCIISLRKKRKEKEDSTKKEDNYGGKAWKKKKELEPWDKKSIVLDIVKSRTPRSIISKELTIVAGELKPSGLSGKDLEEEVTYQFNL